MTDKNTKLDQQAEVVEADSEQVEASKPSRTLWSDAWPKNYFTGPTANLPVLITEYSTNSPFADQHAAGWGAALIVTLMVLALNIATRIVFKEKHHGR